MPKGKIDMDYNKILEDIKRKSLDRMAKLDPHSVMHEHAAAVNGMYTDRPLDFLNFANWTRSFFPGALALLYNHFGDKEFLDYLKELDGIYRKRVKVGIDHCAMHHDAGFTFVLYSIALYEVSGDKKAYNMSLKVCDEFAKTYRPETGLIQGFGGPTGDTITIADDMMNISLFMWAYEKTKHPFFRTLFTNHIDTVLKIMVRDDYSVRHSYRFDANGTPLCEENYCGYAPGSQWARGNAWVIYGLVNAITCLYHDKGLEWQEREKRDARLKKGQQDCVRFDRVKTNKYILALNGILNNFLSKLPENGVPVWDLKELSKESGELYDTSAAVIVASALYKLNEYYDVSKLQGISKHALEWADKILDGVTRDYLSPAEHEAFIDGGQTGDKMTGVTWGDYFYVEAIMRKLHGKDCPEFWSKPVLGKY